MWNYRLIRDDSGYVRVHEVYYTKKGEIWGWSEPVDLGGMKRKDILSNLEYILTDIQKSKILDESWIRSHLAKPKWLNTRKKELLKTTSIDRIKKK